MSTTTADTLNHSFATPLRANSFEAPHSGSGAAGTGGIGGGDDNEFKPKRNPLAFVIGALLVAGAGFGIFKAIEADGAKITPEQATQTRNDLQSRPKAEQLPEWRKWAARSS